MTLQRLVAIASKKERFLKIEDYIGFAQAFLEFTASGLQAVIVSRNEPHYHFWQYRKEGSYNVTRPINSELMFAPDACERLLASFNSLLGALRDASANTAANRVLLNRSVYTVQQCIGVALDALPAGKSNTARKINGDLFDCCLSALASIAPAELSPCRLRLAGNFNSR
jgi:hypothetical protein